MKTPPKEVKDQFAWSKVGFESRHGCDEFLKRSDELISSKRDPGMLLEGANLGA